MYVYGGGQTHTHRAYTHTHNNCRKWQCYHGDVHHHAITPILQTFDQHMGMQRYN